MLSTVEWMFTCCIMSVDRKREMKVLVVPPVVIAPLLSCSSKQQSDLAGRERDSSAMFCFRVRRTRMSGRMVISAESIFKYILHTTLMKQQNFPRRVWCNPRGKFFLFSPFRLW